MKNMISRQRPIGHIKISGMIDKRHWSRRTLVMDGIIWNDGINLIPGLDLSLSTFNYMGLYSDYKIKSDHGFYRGKSTH